MTGSAAVIQPSAEHSSAGVSGDREQLTHLLRSLAARLDHLDRRITDLAWNQRRTLPGLGAGETLCERSALETERARLSDRFGVLASQLRTLDTRVAGTADSRLNGRVGTCPYCGYPSLGSGQCAFCRPHLAR
jgi:hypothetical protein